MSIVFKRLAIVALLFLVFALGSAYETANAQWGPNNLGLSVGSGKNGGIWTGSTDGPAIGTTCWHGAATVQYADAQPTPFLNLGADGTINGQCDRSFSRDDGQFTMTESFSGRFEAQTGQINFTLSARFEGTGTSSYLPLNSRQVSKYKWVATHEIKYQGSGKFEDIDLKLGGQGMGGSAAYTLTCTINRTPIEGPLPGSATVPCWDATKYPSTGQTTWRISGLPTRTGVTSVNPPANPPQSQSQSSVPNQPVQNQPANPPSSSGEGTIKLTTPSGQQTVPAGSRLQVPKGGQVTLSAECQDLRQTIALLAAIWEDKWTTTQNELLKIMVANYKINCGAIQFIKTVAYNRFGPLGQPAAIAIADSPVQLTLTIEEGPGRFQTMNDGVVLTLQAGNATITSQGRSDLTVVYDSQKKTTTVASYSGQVQVKPSSAASPIMLQSGQSVVADSAGLGTIAPIPAVSLGAGPIVISTNNIGALAVFGGIGVGILVFGLVAVVAFMRLRSNRQPLTHTAVPPASAGPFGAAAPTPARLIVTRGTASRPYADLAGSGLTIGQAAANGLVISDAYVSPQHAYLQWHNGAWNVVDAGSQYGTLVNGTRVSWQPLRPGDQIQIGQTLLQFQMSSGSSTAAPPRLPVPPNMPH